MRDAGRNWRRCHYSTIKNRNRKSKQLYCKAGDKIRQISCQNLQNIIVDAERHRRTPGTPATWSEEMGSEKSAGFRDVGFTVLVQNIAKMILEIGPETINILPKRLPQSTLNQ